MHDCKRFFQGLALIALFIVTGCAGSQPVEPFSAASVSSCRTVISNMLRASSPNRPSWSRIAPEDKAGKHYLLGISEYHVTERDARMEAMRHARIEFAVYTGVNVKVLNEISHVIYGKSSGILDPVVLGKNTSIQETQALVRRTRAKKWYIEKRIKICSGKEQTIAYQAWVLAEVPIEEYDKIQAWKREKRLASDKKMLTRQKSILVLLTKLGAAQQETFLEIELIKNKSDIVSALVLLQTDFSRIKHADVLIASQTIEHSGILEKIQRLKQENLSAVQEILSFLVIDVGRDATIWISADKKKAFDLPVWLWHRDENQILPVSSIPLLLKKKEGLVVLTRGKTGADGKLVFRLPRLEAGAYEITLDLEESPFSVLDLVVRKMIGTVARKVSLIDYVPDFKNSVKIGVQQLFAGPVMQGFPVKTVAMGSARYGESRQGSPFGKRLEKEIEGEVLHLSLVNLIRSKNEHSTRSLSEAARSRGTGLMDRPQQPMNSPAMLAVLEGADAILETRYALEGVIVKIDLRLIQAQTGKIIAVSGIDLDNRFIPDGLRLLPTGFLSETPMDKVTANNIVLELTTPRGDGATYTAGEKISYFVSSDHDAYLLLIYVDATGNLLQVFPNHKSGDGYRKADFYMEIPDENAAFDFEIIPPFGLEQVWAFAASTPFPKFLGAGLSNGLSLLQQDLNAVVQQLRTHGKKNLNYGETNVVITTVQE